MEYFDLDPSKFLKLDMEKHTVGRIHEGSMMNDSDESLSQTIDRWVEQDASDQERFDFLEGLSGEEIKKLYIKQFISKEELLKENLELKAKYIKVLEWISSQTSSGDDK